MPTDPVHAMPRPATVQQPIERNILRFALGITTALILALIVEWPLAHATPVLVGLLLGPPARPISGTMAKTLAMALVMAFLLGYILVLLTRNYPLAAILVMGLVLFVLFANAAQGLNLLVVIIFLLAVMVYPVLALLSQDVSLGAAGGFILTMLIAVLISQLSFQLIPPVASPSVPAKPPARPAPHQAYRTAWLSTAVVLPLLVYFMLFDKQGALLTLIFVAILAINPNLTGGIKASFGMVLANIVGGVTAVLVYELLVMVPLLPFYLLLMAVISLLYGHLIFRSPKGALFGTALNAVLLLIGATTSSAGGEASSDFYSRLFLIAAAGLYLTLSFMLLTSLGWLKVSSRDN